MEIRPPRAFISYSHDSQEHEARVLALANRLRDDGVDANLDQYETFPPQGWIRWMNQEVAEAQFVLVVCTETYCRRAEGKEQPGIGLGAIHETGLIQQLLYSAAGLNTKFVPVVFTAEDRAHIPLELQRYTDFGLWGDGYTELYRLLTDQPRLRKPDLGWRRALPARQAKTDYCNSVWNVPPHNPCFTGREAYLQIIHQSWTDVDAVALSGLGGVGKTQIAVEYAHRYRSEYQAALWSSADVDTPVISGFAALATTLDLPERNEKELAVVAGAVQCWLQSHSRWLLVLDNIDTVEDWNLIRRLLPRESCGHVLITTRLHSLGGTGRRVEVEKMNPHDGALVILLRAGLLAHGSSLEAAAADRMAALDISREVDGLPLALDQAGAFIQEVPLAPAEYLSLYRAEGARLRSIRGDMATEHASVTATFSLSFSRLAEKNPGAADLVRVCAFLAPDGIPEKLFTKGGQELGEMLTQLAGRPLDFAEAVRDAGRLALIRRNASAKQLNIHRQVQSVLRDEMHAETRLLWAARVTAALADIFPAPEFGNWPDCEELIPHARAAARHIADFSLDSDAAGVLLNKTAFYLHDRGEYHEAEMLHQDALAIREKTLGPDDPNTAISLNNLAGLYFREGRYAEAEPLYQRALAIHGRALGPEHPDTATTLDNLAALYDREKRYEEAEPLYRLSLGIRERALGPEHPDTATSLNNLAALHYNRERYEEAEPLYRRALAIREKVLAAEHPDTATSLNNLAALFERKARYSEAEPLYRRALGIREKALGPNHPNTATSLNNLAALYDREGRHELAERLYQRALAIFEKALGPNHPSTTTVRSNYAALLRIRSGITV